MGFFFYIETYQAAKFIERDGEFQVENDVDTGEVFTVCVCVCRLLSQEFIIRECILSENNSSNKWMK